ncbi:hypothetical protein IJD44_08640, partial [bacterium]|nr:hypothetical protein [bacterium]
IIDRFSLNTSFKKILPSFVFTLIPAVLYIFNKGFLSTWDEKIDNITYDTCFSYISAFLSEYKTVLFNEYSMFIALIVIILVYLTTRNKEKNEKFIISILSLVAGLFAFLSSLLFAGMRENYTFISHLDIIIQAKTTFLIIIFLLISYILNQKRSLYILSIIALFVTLCSISIAELSSVYQFAIKNKDYKAIHIEKYAHRDIEQYRNRYVNEYIYLWCLYNNKTDNLVFNELFEYSKPSIPYYFKSVYDVDITLHNIDFDKIKYLPNNNKNAVYEHYISIGGNEIPEFYSAEKPNFNKLLDKENF